MAELAGWQQAVGNNDAMAIENSSNRSGGGSGSKQQLKALTLLAGWHVARNSARIMLTARQICCKSAN
ncbi:unnamed protein product [Thelazia callipaeda]|uniref:Lipoprotein n=1 Tax=Thelazia callipaeda TaxID=103827 RepID=A0A0N5DAQ5_THECL|nr:unnamed protein product [Thelazia callipaeda]